MENAVRETLDVTCPQRKFKVREIRDPWITDEILEEIKDKDNYLKHAKISGLVEDWLRAKRERNRVGTMVRDAKAEFVKEQQREHRGDPKKFWKVITSIVPGKKEPHSQITLNDTEGNKIEGAQVA